MSDPRALALVPALWLAIVVWRLRREIAADLRRHLLWRQLDQERPTAPRPLVGPTREVRRVR